MDRQGHRPDAGLVRARSRLADGTEVEVLTLWSMYREHLQDYDLDTVAEITHAPKALIERLANDIATLEPGRRSTSARASTTGSTPRWRTGRSSCRSCSPATSAGRARAATPGPGNYKAALFQGSPRRGPGLQGLGGRRPVRRQPRSRRARQGHRRPRLHQGRRTGLLEPLRAPADRRDAQVRPQGVHRPDAHAHADQGACSSPT